MHQLTPKMGTVQQLKITTLMLIHTGQILSAVQSLPEDIDTQPISDLDGIIQDFSTPGDDGVKHTTIVGGSSEIHEGLHSNKASSLNNLPSDCLLYTSPSPRDATLSRMPSSA